MMIGRFPNNNSLNEMLDLNSKEFFASWLVDSPSSSVVKESSFISLNLTFLCTFYVQKKSVVEVKVEF